MKDLENEIWLPVLELCARDSSWNITDRYKFPNGLYFVSNKGRFRKKNRIKVVAPDRVNTYTFRLCGHKFKLHEIILQTFRPDGNVDGVSPDHIDRGNRQNNYLENLRWATRELQYQNRTNVGHGMKRVLCHENDTIYDSCALAENALGLVENTVSRVARGDRKSIRGYTFSFVE